MHHQGVRPDHVQRPLGLVQPEPACQLGCPDIGQNGRVRRPVTQGAIQPAAGPAFDGGALRADRQGDAQMLSRLGQTGIDGLGPCRTASHGADQQGRLQTPPQEVGAQVDLGVVQIRQGFMDETPVVEARRLGVTPAAGQHHVQVLVLTAQDQVVAHRALPIGRQGWRSTVST
ncbi:hypothetical protein D3C80_1199920 [compost metagenome]